MHTFMGNVWFLVRETKGFGAVLVHFTHINTVFAKNMFLGFLF